MDQSYEGAQSNVNSITISLFTMKSGCKICTQKCYVTLEWPLMLHFKHMMCCPQVCPQKIIPRVKVPLKCNSANKSALFPQAVPCSFSILGRTLDNNPPVCTQRWWPYCEFLPAPLDSVRDGTTPSTVRQHHVICQVHKECNSQYTHNLATIKATRSPWTSATTD